MKHVSWKEWVDFCSKFGDYYFTKPDSKTMLVHRKADGFTLGMSDYTLSTTQYYIETNVPELK